MRIGFRVVARKEQQVRFCAQPVQRAELHKMDAHILAAVQDLAPDLDHVLFMAENLIAALAGIAGARDHHRAAEQLGLKDAEISQIADAGT